MQKCRVPYESLIAVVLRRCMIVSCVSVSVKNCALEIKLESRSLIYIFKHFYTCFTIILE